MIAVIIVVMKISFQSLYIAFERYIIPQKASAITKRNKILRTQNSASFATKPRYDISVLSPSDFAVNAEFKESYKLSISYIEKYYPELIHVDNLYKRLAIYDIVYYLKQYIDYPHINELKEDILSSTNIVIEKDN